MKHQMMMAMMMMMVQFLIPTCKSPTTICIGWLCKTIVLIVVDASAAAADDDDDAVASYRLKFAEGESILFLFRFGFVHRYLCVLRYNNFLLFLHQTDIRLMLQQTIKTK